MQMNEQTNTSKPALTFSDTAAECFTCQADAHAEVHGFDSLTPAQMNHWTMWGCTCTDEQAADAMAFMDMVTR